MPLPKPVEELWADLEAARAEVLGEVERLSQRQADWRPSATDWSVGEIVHHLAVAEIATGKLTTKLTKEMQAGGVPAVFPHDLTGFAELPAELSTPMQAPPAVRPEHGKPVGELIAQLKSVRDRSWQSIEKLAACDPRKLVFAHFHLGDLDLAQWWKLTAAHDRIHLAQIRDVKRAPGFPGS